MIEEGSWAPTGPATVLLDIGGDVGSLVVVTGPSLAGEEIEVESGSAVRIHTAVRERHMGAGVFHAAVFAGIPAGEWGLSVRGGSTRETVHITGGGVLELDWR
ncbi:MAG TPA: hypothetical protein VGS21_10070 [Acidimicrobiales bacterium]|nr:hypothetical protein [Acidimicrobiales bacterium]